jgi:hypothetical protein
VRLHKRLAAKLTCYVVSQVDSSSTVRAFLDLVQRHEQAFYSFVHNVHTKGEALFSGLIHWIEMFITLVREGLGESISLDHLLPHSEDARMRILTEVDAITLHYYKLKVARETKLRRKFGADEEDPNAVDDEIAAALVEGALKDVSFGDLVRNDIDESLGGDEESSSEDDSETESGSTESTEDGTETESESSSDSPPPVPPKTTTDSRSSSILTLPVSAPSHVNTFRQAETKRSIETNGIVNEKKASLHRPNSINNPLNPSMNDRTKPSHLARASGRGNGPQFPELTYIPELVPLFVEMVGSLLCIAPAFLLTLPQGTASFKTADNISYRFPINLHLDNIRSFRNRNLF